MREITINAIQKCKDEIIELKRKIDVMEQEGKPGVEFEFFSSTNVWLVHYYPGWNWQDYKFRVKQKPMEVWGFVRAGETTPAYFFNSEEELRPHNFPVARIVHFIQAPDKEK